MHGKEHSASFSTLCGVGHRGGGGGESQNISPVDREGLLFMHQSSGLSRTGIRMVFLDFAIVTELFSEREG